MPLTVTITPGYNYSKADTVDDENLNKLGNPAAAVVDGQVADFASVVLAMGTAAAPTLKGSAAPTTGLFWDSLELGVAVNGDECVRFTADGVELDDGRSFAGNLIAPAGSKTAPSISFEGKDGTGFWLSGSAIEISVDKIQVMAASSSSIDILTAAFTAKGAKFDGAVEVVGALTVGGTISGTIDKVNQGTSTAPGLGFTSNTNSGLYCPTASVSTNRMGNTVGGKSVMIHNADTGINPYTYFGASEADTDYPTLGDAQVVIDPATGRAPCNFVGYSEQSATGAVSATINNLPTSTTPIPRFLRARLNNSKVLIPCFPFEW